MMTRYFMGDPHFDHDSGDGEHGGIIRMMARVNPEGRLFGSIEEHDRHILNETNKRVLRDDELIIGGDFAWDRPGKFRQQIICKHVRLVRGNHDKVEQSQNTFGELPHVIYTEVRNQSGTDKMKVFISHYPHAYWDGSHKGWGHLYGHCHGQREEELDSIWPQRRALDIGVDNVFLVWGYYGPVSEYQVYDYLARRGGHDDVRFYKDYQVGLYLKRGLL